MGFARIYDVHIPVTSGTDLVFKCCEHELLLVRAKWDGNKRVVARDKWSMAPMPLDGEHDPFRKVGDVSAEMERLKELHGKKTWEAVYPLSREHDFRQMFNEQVRADNPWLIERERRAREEAAAVKAEEAKQTADLLDRAMHARSQSPAAPAPAAAPVAAHGSDDEDEQDLVGALAAPAAAAAPPAAAPAPARAATPKRGSKLSQRVTGNQPPAP